MGMVKQQLIEQGEFDRRDEEDEMSAADHWSKIKELAKAIELGAQDLQDQLEEFNKGATIPF